MFHYFIAIKTFFPPRDKEQSKKSLRKKKLKRQQQQPTLQPQENKYSFNKLPFGYSSIQ